ncbi:hypothetical protein [Pleomorphomonas sp. JP5]|uniref:hypothetical protein n=1 Tax=Pleomorphomonas sp. JP5 TaxID=2942998 RepID=UPI002044597D|nr:hypothetical protein [Pleomorphomonas sp. JP5]MCM5557692.1 hypothetical protein [Pleomorphomonas sp. JP5]
MHSSTFSLALACLLASTVVASAGDAPSRSDMRKACSADYQRLCGDVSPGNGGLRQCFADHMSELSAACVDVLKRRAAART